MDETQTLSEAVATQVRAALFARGIPKRRLAGPLNMTPKSTYRKVAGEVPLSLNELGEVAAYLGIQPWELFPGAPTAAPVQAA